MINGSPPGIARAHDAFILPELRYPRREGLGILVLPDGNKRSDPRTGGYARGARKVIEIAEHLSLRSDVATMIACVLSPENVAARTDAFFADLHRGFAHLSADIAGKGTLVSAGIRAELCGDLTALRARGESAVALADAIEAVIERTRRVTEPSLRLLFGVGYAGTTPRDLDVDIVLRTGIEGEAALRLSGLCSHPSIANFAMMKLWPDVTAADFDEVIEEAKRGRGACLSMGYAPETIVAIVRALAHASLATPVHATLATHAAPQAITEALTRLYAEAPIEHRSVAVECASLVHGWRRGARHELRVLTGNDLTPPADRKGYTSMLAPGQQHPLLVLPEWQYGYATIHACEATPTGIVEGLRAATRFSASHVALFGAERAVDDTSVSPRSTAQPLAVGCGLDATANEP
jgi:undecaprenyl pyrophosphate synthase